MKARKGQKKELKACLEMLREARDARGNVNADEDEIRQHDQALRSGQHHNVRQVTLNQLIGDIQDKQNELTDLNLRDSDALGKSQGPEAIQLKDNG